MLKRILIAAVFAFALPLSAAAQDCYADYKARKGSPMSLHYGVIGLSGGACASRETAERAVARRIGRDGWQLLAVVSVFGRDGLASRRAQAREYFLRY